MAETQTIIIKGANERLTPVKAEIYGPLAIHESILGKGWCVTHVATTAAICADYLPTIEDARRLVEKIAHLPWHELRRVEDGRKWKHGWEVALAIAEVRRG